MLPIPLLFGDIQYRNKKSSTFHFRISLIYTRTMMASDTMATVTHNHPISQFHRAKVAVKIIVYAS